MNVIRAARPSDYVQTEALMAQVHALHVAWRPDVYQPIAPVMPESFFRELVAEQKLWVYEAEGAVLGLLVVQERHAGGGPKATRKTLYIEDLAVLEGHRGQGIGRALLEHAKALARERQCAGVELQVNACNKNALAMYRHCGFGEKSINMELNF